MLLGAALGTEQAVATGGRIVRVTGLSRHAEPTWGGDWITVRGSGFAQTGRRAVAAVYFGRYRAAYTRVLDDHTIRAKDPEVDGARKVVAVTVRLRNGKRAKATAAGRFVFTVPTVRTPIHNGMSTLQSRARGKKVIRRVRALAPLTIAPRSRSWTPAEGVSAVARAKRWLGMPYTWGGGDASGPTKGSPYGNGLLGRFNAMYQGFDCSGLVVHAWAPYLALPHYSAAQYTAAGSFHPTMDELQPGDLLFFSGGRRVIDHVVVYAGAGKVIQAPQSGHVVEVSSLADVRQLEPRYLGATRPASTGDVGAAPTITALSTDHGSAGTSVTVEGADLATTSRIRFGTSATYAVTVVSDSEVRVIVPAGISGSVSVRLGNAWGVSPASASTRFTVTP